MLNLLPLEATNLYVVWDSFSSSVEVVLLFFAFGAEPSVFSGAGAPPDKALITLASKNAKENIFQQVVETDSMYLFI